MKIRCINNEGKDLRQYEFQTINDDVYGRFGVTALSSYSELDIGREYLVMGIIIFESYQAYLIDTNGFIGTYPCQLFEILENTVNSDWHFRMVDREESIYPFIQSLFGYPELCSDKEAYQNLIVERQDDAQRIYFSRKIELENNLA